MEFIEKDEKQLKILKVAQCFLSNPDYTIKEVAEETGISKSSVQRYLNSELINLFCELKEEYDNPKGVIKERLTTNKEEGHARGGINYSNNNIPIKTTDGKFIGSRRK